MSVAKSYEKYPLKGEPFKENNKEYIYIITPKGDKKVRWYDEDRPLRFSQYKAFGFDRGGFITVFLGNEQLIADWVTTLPRWRVWHNTFFGYFMPPFNEIEKPIPEGIIARKVFWEEVRDEKDDTNQFLKSGDWIINYLKGNKEVVTNSSSRYQGQIGEWLEQDVVLFKKTTKENYFGSKYIYIMKDKNENEYIWETQSKDLIEGDSFHIKMKVKEHQENNGIQQTIVYYCKMRD